MTILFPHAMMPYRESGCDIMGNDKNNGYIQVIERAITILDLFTEQNSEWRFSDLVTASGLNKSTVFNIVNTCAPEDVENEIDNLFVDPQMFINTIDEYLANKGGG